jgi:DNA polymerase-3 subunit alpha
VEQILRRHPGPTAISFTLCLPQDIEADTAPAPNMKVLPSEGFVAEVENVLGKGAVVML